MTLSLAFHHRHWILHDRTTSGVAIHHGPWAAITLGRRQASHVNIALGQHTKKDDIGNGMSSFPLDNIHG